MRHLYTYLFVSALACFAYKASAQNTIDYAIRVSAILQRSPAQITLHWPKDSNVTKYFIYRKLKTDAGFSTKTPAATLTATDTMFTDKTVSLGVNYEYELVKTIKANNYYGFGYISTGIEVPPTESRGKLILIVDQKFMADTALKPRIDRLTLDMIEDGWQIITHPVDINADSVVGIHNLILSDYTEDPDNVKAVFLLGHIPVPYSGGDPNYGLNPIDGHKPQHEGAWPADIYYTDMNGVWTDDYVIDTGGDYKAQHNIIGDKKFDQDDIPASVVLQLGRVDLSDMPSFAPLTEADLIARYLDKDHRWRTGRVPMAQRGLVKDYFGIERNSSSNHLYDEAFAACGYKNFAPMFGAKNVIDTGTWENNLSEGSYLWSYGCGGGSYTNAAGISGTSNFAKDSLQTVFMMLFGSWFGDWNVQDNYLRAPLASKGPILTNCWAGRPQWQFHNMAMGDNIGDCSLLNYNMYSNGATDYSSYFRSAIMGSSDRMIHVDLMGDPTLRMHVVQPPGPVTLTHNTPLVTVKWTASKEPNLLGYYIYRSSSLNMPFVRISKTIVPGTTFIDSGAQHNLNFYMVRAIKLEQSPSGSYFNLSQGAMDTITTDHSGIESMNPGAKLLTVYPNPGRDMFHIAWPGATTANGHLEVFDITGNIVLNRDLSGLNNPQTIDLNLSSLTKGIYMMRISNDTDVYVQRVERY